MRRRNGARATGRRAARTRRRRRDRARVGAVEGRAARAEARADERRRERRCHVVSRRAVAVCGGERGSTRERASLVGTGDVAASDKCERLERLLGRPRLFPRELLTLFRPSLRSWRENLIRSPLSAQFPPIRPLGLKNPRLKDCVSSPRRGAESDSDGVSCQLFRIVRPGALTHIRRRRASRDAAVETRTVRARRTSARRAPDVASFRGPSHSARRAGRREDARRSGHPRLVSVAEVTEGFGTVAAGSSADAEPRRAREGVRVARAVASD